MAVIQTNEKQVEFLARLMHAEAESRHLQCLLIVGNTGVNRVIANCLDFNVMRNIQDMAFQSPRRFEATQNSYSHQRDREGEIKHIAFLRH